MTMRSKSKTGRSGRGGLGLALLLTLWMAPGCSGAQADRNASSVDDRIVSTDPDLAAFAAGLIPGIEHLSGLELRTPIRVERRTRDELERYLLATLDEDLPPEEIERITRSYSLLGMIPEDFDFGATMVELFTSQVAGFYEPDSTALYVLDDQVGELLESTLVHELVHALQDQYVDLNALIAPEVENDRRVAAQAAIEGHATLVMQEYAIASMLGDSIARLPLPLMEPSLRDLMVQTVAATPDFEGVPEVITAGLIASYVDGAFFVQSIWQGDDSRPPPFDDRLPLSTEQILERSSPAESAADPPLIIRLDSATPSVYAENLGALETRILLERADPARAAAVIGEWDGDRYALYSGNGGDGLVWVSVWEDESGRDAAYELIERAFESESRPHAVRRMAVEGRPAVELRVGTTPNSVEARLVSEPG